MAFLNPTDVDFNGDQVKAIGEAVITEVFAKPELSAGLTLITGIKTKKQVVILGLLLAFLF